MACFLVPAGEAVITTITQKVLENQEKKEGGEKGQEKGGGVTWSRRLSWLNKLLWGGCILLAFEHIWHGEVVPWWPFLTAMENPADIGPMLEEMALFGGTMAATITVIWGIMILVVELKNKAAQQRAGDNIAAGGA